MTKYNKTYLFADIAVRAKYNYEYLKKQCEEYEITATPQIKLEVTYDDIIKEKAKADGEEQYSVGYLESLAFYRKLCEAMTAQNILLFHSAAVEVEGKAYLFTAPSGTGKTTHIGLWQKLHGTKMRIINGDKPLVKIFDDKVVVYGTPWDGKERQSTNASAAVAGICILTRGNENKIRRLTSTEALGTLMSQTFRPVEAENLKTMIENVVKLSNSVPLWKLECNISEEAAWLSYKTMSKED